MIDTQSSTEHAVSVPEGTPQGARTGVPSIGDPPSWLARLHLASSRGVLALGVLIVLAGGLIANTAQTAGGRIKVEPVRFISYSGPMQTGLLYVPSNATVATPACGVVALHGYINSVDTMDGFAIEMARRGCVVLDANLTGQGDSEPPFLGPSDTDYGGTGALTYINTLPIVRHGDVGLIGHSMGGWASVVAADFDPTLYRSVVLESSSVSTPVYEPVPGTPQFPRNVLVDEAQHSEFATVMWDVPAGKDLPQSTRMQKFFGTSQPIVKGKVYGSVAAGTGRELIVQGTIHPGITIDPSAVEHAVQWMQLTLDGVQPMPAGHQIWYWDEIGTLLALLGVGLLFFGAAGELLRLPYFATV
ncbi:MAG: alpha/beta fold hydrolase, partial [Acidimicrobiales bacterium]